MKLSHWLRNHIYSHYGSLYLILFGLVLLYAIGVENTVGLIVICAGLLFLFLPANYFFYGSIGLLTPILLLAIYGYESQELFNTGITTPDSNQLGASIILTLVFISSTHTLGEKKRYRFFYFTTTYLCWFSGNNAHRSFSPQWFYKQLFVKVR